VQQLDRNGTIANGGGDPLARAVTNVAGGENARHAGLQKERTPFQRPIATRGKISSGEDVAVLIPIDSEGSHSVRGCAAIMRKSPHGIARTR
jgi:hypothetical protein